MKRPADLENEQLRAEISAGLAQANRLAAEGRNREALAACRRLNSKAPGQTEILTLLGVLNARVGNLGKALEHLADALLHSPRNPQLLYHLSEVYLQAGAPVHALHSLRSYRKEVDQIPVAHDLPSPDALISLLVSFMHEEPGTQRLTPDVQDRAMMAAERGRLRLLFNEDPEKALPELREAVRLAPRYAPPRNNMSLAYFYNGQLHEAQATLDATLREVDPENVFALATLAFLRWAGGEDPAALVPLLQRAATHLTPQSRLLDRTRVAEVAGLLGEHTLAHAVLVPAAEPLPDASDPLANSQANGARIRLLATALANLGQVEEAAALLRDNVGPLAGDALARRLLAAFDTAEPLAAVAGGGYPYLGWDDLLSQHLLRRLALGSGGPRIAFRPPPPPDPDQVAAEIARVYPRLPAACAVLLWMGDPTLENLGLTLLALVGTPAADALLDAHLRGTLGSYSGRQQAGYALLDGGRLLNGVLIPFWSGTAWGEIRIFRLSPQGRHRRDLLTTLGTLLQRVTAPQEP